MDNMKSWMDIFRWKLHCRFKITSETTFIHIFGGGNHHRTNGDLLELASSPGSLALTFQKRPWSLGAMEANVVFGS